MTAHTLKEASVVAIDDDKVLLEIIVGILSSYGAIVYPSTSEKIAIELVVKHTPDIIILDRHLGNADGIDILKQLKKNKNTSNIPILMLTGEKRMNEVTSAINAGASGYIAKPFVPDDFIKKVVKLIEVSRDRII